MSTDDIDAMAAQFATDVLVFGAHPDDVEIFCGGTVIRLVELGYCIGVVDLTQGELTSLETPEQRAAGANAASRMLGLVDPVAHFRHNGFSEAHAFEGVR